jgi:hypothetical protein
MKHFKTIAIFQYPAEYAVLQLLFDQAEIRYFFQNETNDQCFSFLFQRYWWNSPASTY